MDIMQNDAEKRHDISKRLYPYLNLSEGEYVIAAVRWHWITIVIPMAIGTFILAGLWVAQTNYDLIAQNLGFTGGMADQSLFLLPTLALTVLVVLGMAAAWYIYDRNRFFVTNESVIQRLQYSIFSRHDQTVDLGSIEDVSANQTGIFAYIFNYGTIRLSTVGNEHTYVQSYAANPQKTANKLKDAVEAYKSSHQANGN